MIAKNPYYPKPKLMEVLRRRRQTLKQWLCELEMTSAAQLELYCVKHSLQAPSTDELIVAFMPVPKPVPEHKPNIIIEKQQVVTVDDQHKKPRKKLKVGAETLPDEPLIMTQENSKTKE